MKRTRDEENGKLDTIEIKKFIKKHKKSSHQCKDEASAILEEQLKPLDWNKYGSDSSTISKKHKVSVSVLPEIVSNEKIGKTRKKHEVTKQNTPEELEKVTDIHLFKEDLKKHEMSDLVFSETNDSIRKKTKKKHTAENTDHSDKNESRNSGVLVGLDVSQDSDFRLVHTPESDSIRIKKKKKHKHDKDRLKEGVEADSSYVSDLLKSKKKSKKKKKQVDIPVLVESVADAVTDKEISDNKKSGEENCARSDIKKDSKQSKKMKTKEETLNQKSDSISKTHALDYLRQWQSDGENWKFQKVRQVWLLHNVYNKDEIGEEDFDILLRYLEPLRGMSREKTLAEAEDIMKSVESKEEADMDEENLLKVQRARQVIQILSIEPGQ